MSSFMDIAQKKGDNKQPHGKLTVYAKVSVDPSDVGSISTGSPLKSMIKDGFLVAQGNYRDQSSLRDFLQQELGTSMDDEDGMRDFIEGLGGIEGAIDPEKFREKLNQIEALDEFIPTPAKMSHFSSESDIQNQEGDVFFVGFFENTGNANLAVNAVTILYQARYRESQIHRVRDQIDSLISEVELVPTSSLDIESIKKEDKVVDVDLSNNHIGEIILKKYVPLLIHSISNPDTREMAELELNNFLLSYQSKDDINRIIELTKVDHFSKVDTRLIELYAYKIWYITDESFDKVAEVVKEIKVLEGELNG